MKTIRAMLRSRLPSAHSLLIVSIALVFVSLTVQLILGPNRGHIALTLWHWTSGLFGGAALGFHWGRLFERQAIERAQRLTFELELLKRACDHDLAMLEAERATRTE